MTTHLQPRLYAVLVASQELNEVYGGGTLDKLTDHVAGLLSQPPYRAPPTLIRSFRAVAAPSHDWVPAFEGDSDVSIKPLEELVVVLAFDTAEAQEEFVDVVASGRALHPEQATILAVGSDIGVDAADHWCPGAASAATFSHRSNARRTIAADALKQHGLLGQRVNVVIVDDGLDKKTIPPANWGGGLNWNGNPANPVLAGSAPRTSHGMMIARSVLDLAPKAVLYDVPLIPQRIVIDGFFSGTSAAQVVMSKVVTEINARRQYPRWSGPWIFVNAWAIFDRGSETPLGSYTQNTSPGGHPLINLVTSVVQTHKFDVIFAAGNCGAFCPNARCGGTDCGPGRSIWGANAMPEVITAGAVLSDLTWAGYSSQGPGPNVNGLAREKPDLCAPSDFCETDDAAVRNSGTSTACAMTGGVVAALRSRPAWNQTAVSPERLKAALLGGARHPQALGWNERLGHGVLDAAGALGNLAAA